MRSLRVVGSMLMLAVGATALGCQSSAGNGALIGGGTGALVGGLIGSKSHARAGEGAVIGGVIGAGAGAIIGHAKDRADERDRSAMYNTRPGDDASAYTQSRTLTTRDVIGWSSKGVKDEIIIDRVEQSGTVFRLTAADENQLRQAGVSEEVIRAMRDTARR